MLLAGSRPLSQWLQIVPDASVDQNLEGNPLERAVFSALLLLGLVVVAMRGRKAWTLALMNGPFLLFLFYCAVSAFWSDYPGVAFRRWIKAVGDPVMIMIVLTDPDRLAGIKRFLARTAFVFMPVSILLVKYYPDLGLRFNRTDGVRGFIGVATDKNMLGAVCLFSGLGAVWRIVHALRDTKARGGSPVVVAQGAILAMALWLLWNANSMTSIGCLVLGAVLIVGTTVRTLAQRRGLVHAMSVAAIAAACVPLFLDVAGGVLSAVGRDPTLTQRTELWGDVVALNPNPWLGAGFESFWLGSRLHLLWAKYQWRPNEAHNGYLEVFLNLGWIGLTLLTVVVVVGYRKGIKALNADPELGRLKVACLVVGVIYSLTEAGFRMMHPMWISTMLAAFVVPNTPAPTPSIVTPRVGPPPRKAAGIKRRDDEQAFRSARSGVRGQSWRGKLAPHTASR
jgi:O-antigen ligase